MKCILTFIGLIVLMGSQAAHAQTLSLTLKGHGATQLRGDNRAGGPLRLAFGNVDGLGISRNPYGRVYRSEDPAGAYYIATLDVITKVTGGNIQNGRLLVQRTRPVSATDFPLNAFYDADFGVRFQSRGNLNRIDFTTPVLIRRDLTNQQTTTSRQLGVFIDTKLVEGRYQGDIIYTFMAQ